jgi:type II secretory pathway component GspD/PulD (secretin)
MKRWFLGSLVLLLALAAPVVADDEKPDDEELVVINIDRDEIEMEAFLRIVSRACQVPMIWDPADRAIRGRRLIGSVSIKMPRSEMLYSVRALLTFYDLVLIPVGPAGYEMTLVADARNTSSILRLKAQPITLTDENLARYEHADGLFVTTTMAVEHMQSLQQARNAFARVVTGQNIGNVTEVQDARAFVVTDFAPNVVAIYRLLKQMDVPRPKDSTTAGRTVAITLEHAQAGALAATLARHYGDRPAAQTERTEQAAAPPSDSAPRITADERTNRILVTGSDSEVEAVQKVIAILDVPVLSASVRAQVIRLKHIDATVAAEVLNAFIRRSPGLWDAGGPEPGIVAHQEAAALLVSASRSDTDALLQLIAELDKDP